MVDVLDTDVSMLRHEEVIVGTETVETTISDSLTSFEVASDQIALAEETVVEMVASAADTMVSVPAVDTTVSVPVVGTTISAPSVDAMVPASIVDTGVSGSAVDTTVSIPAVDRTISSPAVDTISIPAVDTTISIPAVDTTVSVPAVDTTVSVPAVDTTVSVPAVDTTIPIPADDISISIPAVDTTVPVAIVATAASVVSDSTISDTVVTAAPAPPLIKTVMVAPPIGSKGVMTLKEATATTNSQTLKRPIYLIPNSSGSLTMTTVAPVSARASTGEGFVNKVVFATTAPLASSSASTAVATLAGLKVQPGKSLTTTTNLSLVKGNTVTTTTSAAGSSSSSSSSPLITKVIITNNPLTGQATTSLASGQNTILTGLQQPVKIVTAAQAQALVGQNKTMTLTQAGITAPLKQQIFTAIPGTPPKHSTFMLGKIALSPKTPTTITMIPVTMGKSPQKIAPAPIGTTAQLVSKGTVLSVVSTTSTTSAIPKFSTIASSPSKFIIKQAGSTLSLKPGVVGTVSASATGTLNAAGGTIKHITIPTSAVSSGAAIQVPGNKFSYIRLVATPSSAGTTTSSGVKTVMAPVVATTSKPNVPVTVSTIASTSTLGQQRPTLQTIGTSSQLKIAVPIAPAISGQQLKSIGGQQRFLIPASAVSNIGHLRQTSGSITVPANALASLPPGTTLFSPGGNIMMVPAQYVAQFQQQSVVSQSGQQTTAAATSTSLFTASRLSTAASSSSSSSSTTSAITSTSSSATTLLSTAPLLSSGRLPVTSSSSSSSALAVPVSSASFSHDRSHLLSSSSSSSSSFSKHQLNGFVTENRDQRMVNKKELVAHDFVPRRKSGLEPNGVRPRKPCNCTKSQCLKLYCDCFANGEFCYNCNCNNCFNNLEHEEDRQKAIKSCLERNPNAFHPKIGKSRDGEIERRHQKGCNCKRSGCLKNYCECYEAKIMCSHICKCVGCKNFAESADKKTLMHLADAAEVRVQQQTAAKNKLSSQMQDVSNKANLSFGSGERMFSSFLTSEVVEATCQCLLAQAEEGRRHSQTEANVEQLVVQEFGRCLQQIIEYASKTKV